ncbi:polysaccharide deacetylase family protein [Desulfoplanes sp.]
MLKNIFGDKKIVPSIMFHSIGLHKKSDWIYNYISEPVYNFESKIKYLYKIGFNFIDWEELYNYMSGYSKIKLPAILITFDDGYLDNFLYAYPILKRYHAKCTIFVNPDFVYPHPVIRKIKGNIRMGSRPDQAIGAAGFLSWEEMRLMEKSGLVDIQSHSLTHTWYFSGPEVIDFHSPGVNPYPWMVWNRFPEKKPFYLTDPQNDMIKFGSPVYEHRKSLVCRRFYPDKRIEQELVAFVGDNGCEEFFKQRNCKEILRSQLQKISNGNNKGEYENLADKYQRIRDELYISKKVIEKELDKKVEFICWPGGGYDKKVISIAKDVGYKAWTLGSKDQSSYRNVCKSNPEYIKRIGSYTKVRIKGIDCGYASGKDLLFAVKRHQNSSFYKYVDYFCKSRHLLKRVQ